MQIVGAPGVGKHQVAKALLSEEASLQMFVARFCVILFLGFNS